MWCAEGRGGRRSRRLRQTKPHRVTANTRFPFSRSPSFFHPHVSIEPLTRFASLRMRSTFLGSLVFPSSPDIDAVVVAVTVAAAMG